MGKDLFHKGKNFTKIAKKAGEKYGSAEVGKKVAGAILKKMRAGHVRGNVHEAEKFDPKQIKMGIKREHEHTKSDKKAKKIATDHLGEKPDYYSKLQKCIPEENVNEGFLSKIFGRSEKGVDQNKSTSQSRYIVKVTGKEKYKPTSVNYVDVNGNSPVHAYEVAVRKHRQANPNHKISVKGAWNMNTKEGRASYEDHRKTMAKNINEVSKAMMGKYLAKARGDLSNSAFNAGSHAQAMFVIKGDKAREALKKDQDRYDKKAEKRRHGLGLVARKMLVMGEEVNEAHEDKPWKGEHRAERKAAISRVRKMIRRHDLTHEMSDDYGSWQSGNREKKEIESTAKRTIPKKLFRKMWNREADRKVMKPDNKMFHKTVGRKPHKQKVNEADLHELSANTLWNYRNKAMDQAARAGGLLHHPGHTRQSLAGINMSHQRNILAKRGSGHRLATEKLEKKGVSTKPGTSSKPKQPEYSQNDEITKRWTKWRESPSGQIKDQAY